MQVLRAAQVYDGRTFLGAGTVLIEGERILGVERGYPEPPVDVDVTWLDQGAIASRGRSGTAYRRTFRC